MIPSENKGYVTVLGHFKMCSTELQVKKFDVIN